MPLMEALLAEQALQTFLAGLPWTNKSYSYSVTKKGRKKISDSHGLLKTLLKTKSGPRAVNIPPLD